MGFYVFVFLYRKLPSILTSLHFYVRTPWLTCSSIDLKALKVKKRKNTSLLRCASHLYDTDLEMAFFLFR